MNLPIQAVTIAAYNRWMNERLYEACATLTDEQRKRDAGAFFRSYMDAPGLPSARFVTV